MDPRLAKLLGDEGLAPLRRRLRRHFERAAPGESPEVLRLSSLTAAERECLALLMWRPPRDARSMQLDIAAIDTTLREAGLAESLRDALEQLDGPLVHHAALRALSRERWSALVAGCSHPALAAWLQDAAALGLLKRLARQQPQRAAQLLDAASAVLHRLPARGVPLAQLAADTLGDAHALDHGQPAATLVLAVWRQRATGPGGTGNADEPGQTADGSGPIRNADGPLETGEPDHPVDNGDDDDPGATNSLASTDGTEAMGDIVAAFSDDAAQDERARSVWARAGVLVNELARPVLLLNLPVRADTPAVGHPGEPSYLSLRQLLRAAPRWDVDGRDVFVCENPNLVAIAADRLGSGCAPMVCTDGMPAAAQRTLLGQLAQAGARLHYHGDFDWPGIQIANHVLRTWAARHWRLAREDYEAAVAAAPQSRHDLAGPPVAAIWDAALSEAMQALGRAIAEEAVAATLLEDLRKR